MSASSEGEYSVQLSGSVLSASLRPHGLQHARPPNHQFLELAQTHVHWASDAIQPSHPLSSPSLPAFNLSHHQGLSNESVLCIRWQKYWSFSPSNEYSGLIFFRIDWVDLAIQGTLKSLLQHSSSKGSILQRSTCFLVQLSHPYVTTGKTIALTRWTSEKRESIAVSNMPGNWPPCCLWELF